MEQKVINQHDAIRLLKAGKRVSEFRIMFDNEKIVALHHTGAGWRDLGLHWEDPVEINIDTDNKVVFADFAKDETK